MQFTRNILRVYRRATPTQVQKGLDWYPSAHNLAHVIGRGDVWKGAGLISAFSPQTPWWRNQELAITSAQSGIARTDTLGNSSRSAQRILDGEHPLDVLGGRKTRAFCANIALNTDSDDVTIDVHAFSIAHGVPIPSRQMRLGKRLYAELSDCYTRAAKREDILPLQMQAITWVVWREMFPNKAANREV
jgi:hypothetical protein